MMYAGNKVKKKRGQEGKFRISKIQKGKEKKKKRKIIIIIMRRVQKSGRDEVLLKVGETTPLTGQVVQALLEDCIYFIFNLTTLQPCISLPRPPTSYFISTPPTVCPNFSQAFSFFHRVFHP